MATSYCAVPSVVLAASAWLSPGPGASGLLNGKTQAWLGSSFGTTTRASWGLLFVGNGWDLSHTAWTWPRPPAVGSTDAAGRAAPPRISCRTVPRSPGWMGRYVE